MAAEQPSLITIMDKQGNKIGEVDDVITPLQVECKIPGVVADIAKTSGVDVEQEIAEVEQQTHDLGDVSKPIELPLFDSGQDSDTTEPITTTFIGFGGTSPSRCTNSGSWGKQFPTNKTGLANFMSNKGT
jgi:hypothetical protein